MKLIIADDSALIRDGLRGIVEKQGHEVLAAVDTADAVLPTIQQSYDLHQAPDVLITDVRMPPQMRDDGLAASIQARAAYPELGIVVLSQYVAAANLQQLLQSKASGGTGYLLKDRVSHIADFLSALDLVARGGVVIDPDVAKTLVHAQHSGLGALTAREKEVLELMAQGLSNTEIASALFLSAAAVAKHVANIFAKLRLEPGQDNRRVRAILEYLMATGDRL